MIFIAAILPLLTATFASASAISSRSSDPGVRIKLKDMDVCLSVYAPSPSDMDPMKASPEKCGGAPFWKVNPDHQGGKITVGSSSELALTVSGSAEVAVVTRMNAESEIQNMPYWWTFQEDGRIVNSLGGCLTRTVDVADPIHVSDCLDDAQLSASHETLQQLWETVDEIV